MKWILVVGSRTFDNYEMVRDILSPLIEEDTTIIQGGADGADTLAKRFAEENNIAMIQVNADWKLYGPKAGYIRNDLMHRALSYKPKGEKLIVAFWDGKSKGTKHSFALADIYENPMITYNYTCKSIHSNKFYKDM